MPNLKYPALSAPEILRGSKIQKMGHVTNTHDPVDLILHFFLTAIHLYAKFEVSSFIRPGYIRGSKNSKVGHVTPHDPFRHIFCIFFVSTDCHSPLSMPNYKYPVLSVRDTPKYTPLT